MFEELPRYPKEKVKVFLKYLVHAASKEHVPESHSVRREDLLRPADFASVQRKVLERLNELDDERREILETKIKAFYTKNKFLPLEIRLRKLKEKVRFLKKAKKHNPKKIASLEQKITHCQKLLKDLKIMESSSVA